ncbi:hypothetical protein P6P35_10425 [Clostridium perfringens]|nr:hypothetical protein [Clostridium perfringens]MDK0574298.1 hypothetical protein [Clostridium perfringens]
MSKNCKKHKTDSISPCSNNYDEKIKNKANENTPYESTEPSSKTTYK